LTASTAFLNAFSTSPVRKYIQVGKATWSYVEMGEGDDLWITFHGYGQSGEVMAHFMRHFKPDVRSVHIDIPFHGETDLGKESLQPSDLTDLVTHVLRDHHAASCSLLAFSLGGKVALKLVELMPGKIDRMVLIAPDGLKINPLYRFTANTPMGKWLYGRVIDNPNRVLGATRLLTNAKLLDKKIDQFIHHQLATRESRQMVYNVWRAFRFITPDLVDIRSKIHRYNITTLLVFGKFDTIIRPSLGRKLDDVAGEKVSVLVLEKSHNLITTPVAEELQKHVR